MGKTVNRYASDTEVPIAKSRAEIEATVTRYGADQFVSGWRDDTAMIGFRMKDRMVRFVLPLPSLTAKRFERDGRGTMRSPEKRREAWEQAGRQVWRALALVIKAKLEAVASGITEFEDEFMSNIVMPDGRTVGEHIKPAITQAYTTRTMPPLLPDYSGGRS